MLIASTVQAPSDVVKVYDSEYNNEVAKVIMQQTCSLEVVQIQNQSGDRVCGLFAIGISTDLCFGLDPKSLTFDQVGTCIYGLIFWTALNRELLLCFLPHS